MSAEGPCYHWIASVSDCRRIFAHCYKELDEVVLESEAGSQSSSKLIWKTSCFCLANLLAK
jgi:hypothetical protein